MKKYATVDKSKKPLIIVSFAGEKATDENFPFYLMEVRQCYDDNNKIAIIFDATNAVFPGLTFQKMQADWLRTNTKMMQNFCVGTAYIIPNLLIRNVLKAIFAIQKQPVPFIICDSFVEAEIWATEKLG